MPDTIQIGRRLVPLEHIVLLEPFDATAQTRMVSDKPFQTRIVLIDRDSVLTEEPLAELAERHAFRMLPEDGIATNGAVHFTVEAFEPTEGFTPTKPYRARLRWRDHDGEVQSKLLVTAPEDVLAISVRGQSPRSDAPADIYSPRARRRRKRAASPVPA